METDSFSLNLSGVRDLVASGLNKVPSGTFDGQEGVKGDKQDVLDLDMTDAKLLELRNNWEAKYAPYEAKYERIYKANKTSYLGKEQDPGPDARGGQPIANNLQFEAEETFLPAALSKNPEPVVYADNTPEGNQLASDVKTMLQYHADILAFRRKLTVVVRQWSIYHLGVLKYGWNSKVGDVDIENRKIQDFIFDPEGYVDAYGDFTSYLGERITVTAEKLVEMFPKHKETITALVDRKLGTKCVYTEWWTDEYSFTTFKNIVLDKHKNQFFKYDEPTLDLDGNPVTDETGQQQMNPGRNHFAQPKKPFTFLSVFSLQEQPHDITGLIEQNIPNQNLITKRTYQIDKNISRANNSIAFSENNFNQETGKQAATAFEKGNPVLVPSGGPISEAIVRFPAEGLPDSVFKDLENNIENLRTSWGVQGISAQPPSPDETARGMILNQSHDTTRIGGGIGDAIEQVADSAFNWLVQLYHVYYDEPHFAAIMGNAKAVEYVTLSAQNINRQLIVSVSPDSMRPRDEITEMNLAQTLFDKKAIGPKTLLKMLNFPNPDEAAADGVLYAIDPATYFKINFPEEFQAMQQAQAEQAQTAAVQGAQAKGMETAAVVANTPPEAPANLPTLSNEPASASLSQVPLPK